MLSKYFFFYLIACNLLHASCKFYVHWEGKRRIVFFSSAVEYLDALQSGYTCQPTVKLTCPESKFIVILEVTYSTECNDESNDISIYAPSRCVGYYRERISSQCNGQEQCLVDNSAAQQPSFLMGKQANCAFKGQSVNIEYSCVPGKSKTQMKNDNYVFFSRFLCERITYCRHLFSRKTRWYQRRIYPFTKLS